MPEDESLDARAAAALVQQTQDRTRAALTIAMPSLYAAWGVAWLVGFGAMWLSVREQEPFRGPSVVSAVILGILIVAALVVTVVLVTRATAGVAGSSELQGKMYGLAWPVGFGALFSLEGALAHHGASDEVMGILGAAGPLLVTGLIYVVGAAIWLDRSMLVLGVWLGLVVAAGVWTGPVALLLVEALAGGGGFLLAAAVLARRHRP